MGSGKLEDAALEQSRAAVASGQSDTSARIRALEFAMAAAQADRGRQNIQAQAVCQEAERFLTFITGVKPNNEG